MNPRPASLPRQTTTSKEREKKNEGGDIFVKERETPKIDSSENNKNQRRGKERWF